MVDLEGLVVLDLVVFHLRVSTLLSLLLVARLVVRLAVGGRGYVLLRLLRVKVLVNSLVDFCEIGTLQKNLFKLQF